MAQLTTIDVHVYTFMHQEAKVKHTGNTPMMHILACRDASKGGEEAGISKSVFYIFPFRASSCSDRKAA